jgi:hypothetical protein
MEWAPAIFLAAAIFGGFIGLIARMESRDQESDKDRKPPELPRDIQFNSFFGAPSANTAFRFADFYWQATGKRWLKRVILTILVAAALVLAVAAMHDSNLARWLRGECNLERLPTDWAHNINFSCAPPRRPFHPDR